MATMTYTEQKIVDAYAVLFNNLSDICKKALTERLSKSAQSRNKVVDGFTLSYGGWEDTQQTTEEIKYEIKANRNFRIKERMDGIKIENWMRQ